MFEGNPLPKALLQSLIAGALVVAAFMFPYAPDNAALSVSGVLTAVVGGVAILSAVATTWSVSGEPTVRVRRLWQLVLIFVALTFAYFIVLTLAPPSGPLWDVVQGIAWAPLVATMGAAAALGVDVAWRLALSSQERSAAQRPSVLPKGSGTTSTKSWDVFISHASEDKEKVVRPLVTALEARSISAWVDEQELTIGDVLTRKIDEGLAKSSYGVVIISRHFLAKEWPKKELDGLDAREDQGQKVILPVWHEVSRQDVLKYSPRLANRLAADTRAGVEEVAEKIRAAIGR